MKRRQKFVGRAVLLSLLLMIVMVVVDEVDRHFRKVKMFHFYKNFSSTLFK